MRLRKLRQEREGLSMGGFAKILGIAPASYQFYEYGKSMPRYEILLKIAEYFDTTPNYLLGVDDVP